ncbi:hypothetical protein F5144DRAFT_587045 [Chaetomium tenue]|uniref:Uncharacterized protein n=1 Tax=Chaetomium tenue TaxID=1854479 RepID=A0ACB7NY38_9PEZI|nr:hypothetical protein F5144DRAFT_587045 [Chaetomium globosum]
MSLPRMILTQRRYQLLPSIGRTTIVPARVLPSCRRTIPQVYNISSLPGKNPDDMGGPGGQEHYPESAPLRRRYTITTMYGVFAACLALVAVRAARLNSNAGYVLVHDSSKGELDDVKYVKVSDLPKSRVA